MNHDRVPVSNVGSAHIITLANLDCAVCDCPVEQQARQRLVDTNHSVSESNRQVTAMSGGRSAAIGIPVVVGVLAVVWPERVERGKSAYDIEARRRASTRMAKREDRA